MSRNHLLDKKKLLEKLLKTPIVEVACKQIGLPRSTYYRWRKEDLDFASACDEAFEQSAGLINDMAESQLINSIKEKNMTAIIFWLKNHHRSYKTRVEVDAHVHADQQALTAEQAALVAHALQLAGLTALPEPEGGNDESRTTAK